MRDTGFEEISFLSLRLVRLQPDRRAGGRRSARHGDDKLSIGLPSLRIETFSARLPMDKLEKGRRRSGLPLRPRPPPTGCGT